MSEVYIDDASPAVVYSGNWQFASVSQQAYNHTVHYTTSLNAEATLTFTGISVMVYGVVLASESSQSSYSLDGGNSTVFNAPSAFLTQYGALFYTSPILPNGQHNLTITSLNDTEILYIDYFVIVTTGTSASSSSLRSTFSPSPVISSSKSTVTNATVLGTTSSVSRSETIQSSTTSSLVTLSTFDITSGSNGFRNGGIQTTSTMAGGGTDLNSVPMNRVSRETGAIIGGVTAFAIIAFFVVCLRRQRRRKRFDSDREFWTLSPIPSNAAPLATTTTNSLMNERPPGYAMSEPPAYDVAMEPMVQLSGPQLPGSGVGLMRLGASSPPRLVV